MVSVFSTARAWGRFTHTGTGLTLAPRFGKLPVTSIELRASEEKRVAVALNGRRLERRTERNTEMVRVILANPVELTERDELTVVMT